jgi:hypothetical protein
MVPPPACQEFAHHQAHAIEHTVLMWASSHKPNRVFAQRHVKRPFHRIQNPVFAITYESRTKHEYNLPMLTIMTFPASSIIMHPVMPAEYTGLGDGHMMNK